MFSTDDTIVAIATPTGHGGIGVVRVAGPRATEIGTALLPGAALVPRYATLRRLRAGEGADTGRSLDRVIATLFPRPSSYTGDDVLEISAHGSPILLERIVRAAIDAGARLARPGEFTLRAFLNGKIDLVQAEAVADLIDAVTPAQARVAFDQLDGTLSQALGVISRRLFDLRARLEASLDFPDEGYHFIAPGDLVTEIAAVQSEVAALLATGQRGRLIREGRTVVVLGPPNAGKSSLFNRLLQSDRAIVAAEPGTTRDLLTERVEIQGLPVTLVDTAGLRPTGGSIEREGMARAHGAASAAAVRIVVLDRSRSLDEQHWTELRETTPGPRIVVANKADKPANWPVSALDSGDIVLTTSAVTGEGITKLGQSIAAVLSAGEVLTDTPSMANVRHLSLLQRVADGLREAAERAAGRLPEEIVLMALQESEAALDEIVGRRTPDDLLEAIFSRFCIGK